MNLMSAVSFLATMGGAGRVKKMPGTVGTLVAIPIWYFFYQLGPLGYVGLTVSFIIFAIMISDIYDRNASKHDSSEIVIDEVAGYLTAMVLLPLSWVYVVAGFLLFRLFDIWKPSLIGKLNDRVQGGLGVVVDDLAAGLLANIVLQVVNLYLKDLF